MKGRRRVVDGRGDLVRSRRRRRVAVLGIILAVCVWFVEEGGVRCDRAALGAARCDEGGANGSELAMVNCWRFNLRFGGASNPV